MPYRAELKRPDLKGQFPCSVCGKIFCHSSSLSRHRMQAHFKSYTCTQCNTDISSNETLRSHLFRVHSISRMFMCRCCNWAFPDKTSLHIHMQSMLRNGQPGEVPVLARSSTEDGPGEAPSPSHENKFSSSSLFRPLDQMHPFNPLNAQTLLNSLKKSDSTPSTSSVLTPAQLLNVWLTNNPFMANLANPMTSLHQNMSIGTEKSGDSSESLDSSADSPELDEDSYIEINIKKEDLEDEMAELDVVSEPPEDSFEVEEKKEGRSGSMKRKATKPQQLMGDDEEEDSSPLKLLAVEKTLLTAGLMLPRDACSPTVSDSHTSSGSSGHHGMDSPPHHQQHSAGAKCFDCQELKSKLSETDAELRKRTMEVLSLTGTVDRLQKQILLLAQTCKQRDMQALQQNHLALLRANMLRANPAPPVVSAPSPLPAPTPQVPTLTPEILKRFVEQMVQNNQAAAASPQSSC